MSSNAKPPRSLQRELSLWLLWPLVLVFLVNAAIGYTVAIGTANEAYDRLLLASVKAIADRVTLAGEEIAVDMPYVALELFESNIRERIFYRVSAPDGTTITGYEDLPPPPAGPHGGPVFFRTQYRGERLYQAALYKPLYAPTLKGMVLIQVGETAESRDALSRRILYDSLMSQGLLITLATVFLALGLRRALLPLRRLRESIVRRDPDDLTPVDGAAIQSDVRPLIEALNAHTARIDRMVSGRARFVTDAAHQIRTRMSILTTQLEYGMRLEDPKALREIVENARTMVEDAARFFNQLLFLAQAEATTIPRGREQNVDIAELAHSTALDWVEAARGKQINLGFEGEERGRTVRGDRRLLHELIVNLLDNAIRYTQAGGTVTVRVREDQGGLVLEVEDDGPGIPEEERARAFERFYRAGSQDPGGSGLGLAIAQEISLTHHARIELLTPPAGRGLLVAVRFPAPEAGASGPARAAPSA